MRFDFQGGGGIGLSVHNIRARGTPIHGTRGVSNGLVPMLRVYDVTSRYVDQGVVSDQVPLPFTWSPGMPTCSMYSI